MMEKPRCVYNKCFHDDNEHHDGLCWRITQPEEEDNHQYCPCTYGDSTHRTFDSLGFMTVESKDTMVTTYCAKCNREVMLRLDEPHCHNCKNSL